MNADQLLAHFDRVSDAADAIPRLRRFILDLAVRGKLVEQDRNDQPAAVALTKSRRALAAKTAAVRRGGWKASAPFVASDAISELPAGWVQARVNDTGFFVNGLAFKPSDWRSDGLPIIRIQNLTDPDKPFNYAAGDYPDDVIVRDGDVLVSWSATLDAFIWDRRQGVLNQHIFRVKPAEEFVDRRFLLILLRHAIRDMADGEHAHGLVMTHINRGPFLNHVVAVPPLAEQHRIVAKMDELTALCDQLEAAQAERESRRDRLAAASLHRLNKPDDASNARSFREHARFHLDHLSRLTTRPEQISRLRETIFNLAVRGQLVPQEPADEPAREEIRRIGAAKSRGMKKAKGNPQKLAEPANEAERRFQLRPGWIWTQVQELCTSVTDGDHLPPPKTVEGVPLLVIGDVRGRSLDFRSCRHVSQDYYDRLDPIRQPRRGDVLYTLVGSFGIPVVVRNDRPFCVQRHIGILRPAAGVDVAFLCTVLESPLVFDQAAACATGIAQKTVPLSGLRRINIPLPPLAEQHRIVAKVDELMALCDRLEAQLTTGQMERSRLLDALLHEALASAAQRRA